MCYNLEIKIWKVSKDCERLVGRGYGDMRKAFTLLELVFVLVVIGILAAVIIPNTRTNPVREAAVQLVSHIRYTQHLAMVDDKFDAANANWYRDRWQIVFIGNKYSIISDINATDPMNANASLSNIDLGADYSTTITLGGGCAGDDISFDHLGRPIVGDISDDAAAYEAGQLLTVPCVITLSNSGSDQNESINIEPETGYAHIN